MPKHRLARLVSAPFVVLTVASCGTGDPTVAPITAGTVISLNAQALPALAAEREGSYQAWLVDGSGRAVSAGRFVPGLSVPLTSPIGDVRELMITVEPPGDTNDQPSEQRLLTGRFRTGRAELTLVGAVTQTGVQLRENPGTFTMFTPSDNHRAGYPSFEEAGVWLFNVKPRETPQNDTWVRLAQLQPGWTYEGWMVRDYGSAAAIWLSYGKFRPDPTGALSSRDDTGWGPFSGVIDFTREGVEEFPGDDWISNPLGHPFPAGLTLPLNLRERAPNGSDRWTHVITIEPILNKGEPFGSERPFFIRPYRDPYGQDGPGVPRRITLRTDAIPAATAVVQ